MHDETSRNQIPTSTANKANTRNTRNTRNTTQSKQQTKQNKTNKGKPAAKGKQSRGNKDEEATKQNKEPNRQNKKQASKGGGEWTREKRATANKCVKSANALLWQSQTNIIEKHTCMRASKFAHETCEQKARVQLCALIYSFASLSHTELKTTKHSVRNTGTHICGCISNTHKCVCACQPR